MYEQASHSSNVRISFAMSTLATVILNPAERNLHNAPWYFLFTVLCQVLVGRRRGGLSDNNMEVAMFWIMVFEEWRTRKYGFVPIISECSNFAEEFYTESLTDRSPCLVITGQRMSGLWNRLWTTIFTTVFPSQGYLVTPRVDP